MGSALEQIATLKSRRQRLMRATLSGWLAWCAIMTAFIAIGQNGDMFQAHRQGNLYLFDVKGHPHHLTAEYFTIALCLEVLFVAGSVAVLAAALYESRLRREIDVAEQQLWGRRAGAVLRTR